MNRWAEGNGWPASSWGGGAGVQHEAAAVGRAERGIEEERESGGRDRRKRSRIVCFDGGLQGDPREARPDLLPQTSLGPKRKGN
jgi:hypothetical protein